MSLIFPLIIGIVPSFIWALFFIREDEVHPEPKKLLLYAFLAGAGITLFVIGPQLALAAFLTKNGFTQYGFWSLFVLAAVEEIFKFFAVYITIARFKDFDEPLDAMVYMIIAALGFAAVENVASIARNTLPLPLAVSNIEVLSLRFIGATLLHSLSSALVGYYWGLAMIQKHKFSLLIMEGLGVAIILHAVFNYLIVLFGPSSSLALLLLITTSFFIFNDFEHLKMQDEKA